jgi:hypothetical protein
MSGDIARCEAKRERTVDARASRRYGNAMTTGRHKSGPYGARSIVRDTKS